MPHGAEGIAEVADPLVGGERPGYQVPLIDHEDAGLVLPGDVVAKLLVYLADPLAGIEEQQGDVRLADAPLCSARAVEVDVGGHALAAAKAGRVDGHEGLAVQLETDVDAVAGSAWDLAYDHPLGVGQRVDERALARVPPAHDGHFHRRVLVRLGRRGALRQTFVDRLQNRVLATALLCTYSQHLMTETIEHVRLRVPLPGVGLVGQADDRRPHVAKPLGDLFIQGGRAGAGVDHEQDHVRRVDGNRDLLFDVLGQGVRFVQAHPTGVDQLRVAILDLQEMRHAVAGDAGGGIDDRNPSAGQPVEDARLADVRSTDNHNPRDSHRSSHPGLQITPTLWVHLINPIDG